MSGTQIWTFEKHIYDGSHEGESSAAFASVPNGFFIEKNILRIYFSKRNLNGSSLPFFLDFDVEQQEMIYEQTSPLLDLGDPGTFDDSGVMPTCTVKFQNEVWLYYIGWNLGVTVPFRNSVGLAVSKDNGSTFTKMFPGPVLDRTKTEPHFVASSCILIEDGRWKIWYLSCSKWEVVNNEKRHYYHIRYAESSNGIDWERNGIIAIDFKNELEYAISVPRVIKESGIYKMWYSYRAGEISENYRIGYAESPDGKIWTRMDETIEFHNSGQEWDSEMICYPFIFDYRSERYMLYNGNGFGKTGFGIVKLKKDK